jgi:hypothetical protein
MEKHFLDHLVAGEQREQAKPWYNPEGDCIIYQIADEAVVAERIDEVLTVYRSVITDKLIGCQIKGVAALAKRCGWEGVLVQCRSDDDQILEVSLFALLLAAYEQGPKTIGRRKGYADAFESCADRPRIRADDLESVLT